MKKILLSILTIINANAYDYKLSDIQDSRYLNGYNLKSIEKFLDKNIEINGKIEEFSKNSIRLLSSNEYYQSGEINYIYFKIFENNNSYNNILLSILKLEQNITVECIFTSYTHNYEDCNITKIQSMPNTPSIPTLEEYLSYQKELIFIKDNWYMVNSKIIKLIDNSKIDYIWEYNGNDKEWYLKNNINENNQYKKIEKIDYEKSYWVKVNDNFKINYLENIILGNNPIKLEEPPQIGQ